MPQSDQFPSQPAPGALVPALSEVVGVAHLSGPTAAGAMALAAAQALARKAAAPATLRAYKADWTHYAAWCATAGFVPVPAAPATVGAYLASLAESHACEPAVGLGAISTATDCKAQLLLGPASALVHMLELGRPNYLRTARPQAGLWLLRLPSRSVRHAA